jgi:hypothetical protein
METRMDASPIKTFSGWLWAEAVSIPVAERTMTDRSVDTSELRRMIAAGEYRLDAHAIAEAMFARADRDMTPASLRASKVLEAREADAAAGGVE